MITGIVEWVDPEPPCPGPGLRPSYSRGLEGVKEVYPELVEGLIINLLFIILCIICVIK